MGYNMLMTQHYKIGAMADIDVLIDQTATLVEQDDESIIFHLSDGTTYAFIHSQSCCEYVYIEDISGDLSDLMDSPILLAESIDNEGEDRPHPDNAESFTWTFYKFATVKGYVTVRWLGSSNGYYSESVNFQKLEKI